MLVIETLNVDSSRDSAGALVELLTDAVHSGASIGFLCPLGEDAAKAYWLGIFAEVAAGSRLLLVARIGGQIVGSVQLSLCMRENGLHRAEVQKLMVHTAQRCKGIGKMLMAEVERQARAHARSLLYLDTESGGVAAAMYGRLGWQRAGEIPQFARSPDGTLHGTVIFYKEL